MTVMASHKPAMTHKKRDTADESPLRILYAAGAGDVLGTYKAWREGRDDPRQVVHTYSGQFFDLVSDLGASAYVITRFGDPLIFEDGDITIEQRPNRKSGAGGLQYHLGQIQYGLGVRRTARKFGADVAIICEGTTHWFMLPRLAAQGVHVVPSCHTVLWTSDQEMGIVRRLIRRLNRRCFSESVVSTLVASDRIGRQVRELAGDEPRPIRVFLPKYRRAFFDRIETEPQAKAFTVLCIGRIERNKGVFDLLEMAKSLQKQGRSDIEFDVCGDGSAMEELRAAVEDLNLESTVRIHGHCDRDRMVDMFSRCHCVIAPTKSTFVEGFNQVLTDAVLAGRPVISSSVCPAIDYVERGAVRVPPDDVDAYVGAILRLADDQPFFAERRAGCLALQEQFYDGSQSWEARVREAIAQCAGLQSQPNHAAAEAAATA